MATKKIEKTWIQMPNKRLVWADARLCAVFFFGAVFLLSSILHRNFRILLPIISPQ